MSSVYTARHRVLAHECDSFGHVNNAAYIRHLEQATLDALGVASLDGALPQPRWLTIEYHAPARYGDEMDVAARVMAVRGAAATWAYRVTRATDGAVAVAAQVAWDGPKGAAPVPRPDGHPDVGSLPAPLKPFSPPRDNGARPFRWRQTVRLYELSASGNVGMAAYFNWLEEATFRAARVAGWPLERMKAHNFIAFQYRHDAEFFQSIGYPDEVDIVSRLVDVRRIRGTWIHEVFRAADGGLLMRDYSTGASLRWDGKLRPVPAEMMEALRRGEPPAPHAKDLETAEVSS